MKKLLQLILLFLPLLAFAQYQDSIINPPPVNPIGCTDVEACNFSITAFIDDGSCEYYSCVEPCSDINENGVCDEDEDEEETTDTLSLFDSWIIIDIHTDDWPEETSWELVDSNDVAIASGGPYDSDQTLFSETIELNSGEYYYFLFDSYGDGLWTGGYVEIYNSCEYYFYHEGPFTGNTIDEVMNEDAEWQQNELIESLTITPCAPPIDGCTDEIAINYNEEAFEDDGSCEYIEGCTNENASNYDPEAAVFPSGLIIPGGSCNLEVWGQNYFGIDPDFYFNDNQDLFEVGNKLYIGESTFYVDFVAEVQGNCNAPAVLIYVVFQEAEADGNLGTFSPGLNVNAVVGEYWYMDPCIFIYGCTDPNALNYNPEAGVNDNSCINIPGCTDPTSNMYNPAATVSDGSCEGGDISCSEGKTVVTVEIILDQYTNETGWAIYDGGGTIIELVAPGTYDNIPDYGIVETQVCIDNGTSVLFSITDTYGDGLAGSIWGGVDGSWIVYTPCDTLSTGGGNFGPIFQENIFIQECTDDIILGCTDSEYTEYDAYATEDDGSCSTLNLYGCVDIDAFNYDEEATSMLYTPSCNNTLTLQDWGDNGWAGSFLVVTQGDNWWGPFTLESDQSQLDTVLNLNTTEMINTYFYSFGNSQQTAEQCKFEITNPVGLVIANGGTNPYTNPILSYNQYGFIYKAEAKCGDNCIPKVYGCLEEGAVNYIATANTSDGSCYYNPGCTNEAYTEYYTYIDANGIVADYDNGSCIEFAVFGCMDEDMFNFDFTATVNGTAIGDLTDPCEMYVIGCTDGTAFNYNELANLDFDGLLCTPFINGCMDIEALNYDEEANTDNGSCIEIVNGCTDSTALNYDSEANVDDNTCTPFIYGCTDSESFNYDSTANTDNDSCVPIVTGCTNTLSVNYNSEANTDDGSCILIVYGCMDETALNYNPDANTDNDSCIAIIEGCTDSSALNYDELANVENFTCIPVVNGCMDSTALNYDIDANVDNDSCIEIVEGCTDSTALNYNDLANLDDFSCIAYIYGCTDETALNYNDLANTDNDSCIPFIYGCTNQNALNYDSTANTDNFSCILPIYGCMDVDALNYDINANVDNETCIEVVIGCTNPIALNYNELANTDDFSCVLPIYGCMNIEALNYDELANVDNGTCIEIIEGCTDPTALNYNELANVDDFSCIPFIYGCTDSTALNYNDLANTDNGTCIEYVYGCTDPTAFNYDADANTEDFSCIEVVIGCTDEDAINYDPLANTNSGGCIDVLIGCTDINAYNYIQTANTDDGSCEYDAGCSGGPGEPYWLPNECFAWVISIDSNCCEGEWDNYCVELYNYCDLGWPIELEENSNEIFIYPNPVTDILNISKEIDIKIYDMIGNLVIFKEKTKQINMVELPDGIYNLSIIHNNKNINNRIVKQ